MDVFKCNGSHFEISKSASTISSFVLDWLKNEGIFCWIMDTFRMKQMQMYVCTLKNLF